MRRGYDRDCGCGWLLVTLDCFDVSFWLGITPGFLGDADPELGGVGGGSFGLSEEGEVGHG